MILNALDEVLYWDDVTRLCTFVQKNMKKYHPHDPDSYYKEKERFLRESIPDKTDFIRRMQYYQKKGGPVWVSGRNQLSDDITAEDLRKAICISATAENGRSKAAMVERIFERDPDFWNFYSRNIVYAPQNTILELTVGAGVGTTAVMRTMTDDDLYMGVDIDFICAKNADALAKHFGVKGLGIATSLWNMPFDDAMFTTVCSNAGLEECREIPTILKEASRVLVPTGRLVLHCLKPDKAAWYPYFSQYGFSDSETRNWLKKLRLYADIEQIKELAAECGLQCRDIKCDDAKGYIVVFEK